MRDRPIFVWIICFYLIISSSVGLVRSFETLHQHKTQLAMKAVRMPIPAQITQYYLGLVVPLITAMFMYEGFNWARVVYITWGILNYLLEMIVLPYREDALPGLPIFAFIAVWLLLPRAREFFCVPQFYS